MRVALPAGRGAPSPGGTRGSRFNPMVPSHHFEGLAVASSTGRRHNDPAPKVPEVPQGPLVRADGSRRRVTVRRGGTHSAEDNACRAAGGRETQALNKASRSVTSIDIQPHIGTSDSNHWRPGVEVRPALALRLLTVDSVCRRRAEYARQTVLQTFAESDAPTLPERQRRETLVVA